jgi:hypothetical protein
LEEVATIMKPREEHPGFDSSVRFDENRIHAAAVYCSDGRYGEQFDDFLHNGLKLPRYDRLAVPGGAACLAGHFLACRQEDALIEQLRFLIRAHGLQKVVLIAHQGCAFYTDLLHVPAAQVEARQREDLLAAVDRIRSVSRELAIGMFFARRYPDGKVRFESWAIGKAAGAAHRA